MGLARVDQSTFAQGQIDPRVQARIDWESYYKAAKEISNGLVIPQGGVQRRWGTTFVASTLAPPEDAPYTEISTMIYNDNLIYLFLWTTTALDIFLENINIEIFGPTQYQREDIPTLRFSQVQTRYIITSGNYAPQQLVRSANAPIAITAFSALNNTLTAAAVGNVGQILPVQFTTTGALPTTNPQIFPARDYFIKVITVNTFQIYSTSSDAVNNVNTYVITNAGVNSNVVVQNTWNITNIAFKNRPTYDFNGGYTGAGFTFTPSAVSGAITITASAPIFTAAMVGGIYQGNGGIARIVAPFISNVQVNALTIEPFPNTNAIPGLFSFLGEPAWSDARGWPRVSSFFQNRLVFANTASLPSGQWFSVINDVYNFDDSQTLADDAIASYPESGTMSVIQSMTSGRSMVVHTNTGNYSSPVQTEIVITPTSYLLTEQNKYGVGILQPVFIDNQIFFVDRSGNNVINMIWEFTQSSYVTDSISVKATNLINNPVDMAAFFEPQFIDGFFVLFVNIDGSLAVLQTLHEQNISAFSGHTTFSNRVIDQVSNARQIASQYVKVNSAQNRCWFLTVRRLPVNLPAIAITGFNAVNETLHTTVPHGMTVNAATLVSFTTTGVLPTTIPPLNITQYFWANATDANNFEVFSSEADAAAAINAFQILDAGVNSNVVLWIDTGFAYIEEVNFNVYTDCSKTQTFNVLTTVIPGLDFLNGQVVQVVGDGYVLNNQTVFNGQITIERPSFVVSVGIPYTTTLVPLPPALPGIPGSLYQPRHIRNLYVNYYNTIGSQVQSFDMPVVTMQQVIIGAFPSPQTGVFEYTLMEGWDGATPVDIQIVQSQPLPMTIIGLSYILEV